MKPKASSLTRSVQLFQVARYGIWFVLTICLARIDPSKLQISQYETLMLLAGSLSFFWISGLFDSLMPLYRKSAAALQPPLMGQALRLGMMLGLLAAAATFGIARVSHPELGMRLVFLFCLYQGLHLAGLSLEHYWMLREKGRLLLCTGVSKNAVLAIELALPLMLGKSLETAFVWMATFAGLRLAVQLLILRRSVTAFLPKGQRLLLVRSALPLTLAALLGGGATYVDSNLVRAYFSDSEFVNFTYGARELPLALLLANALSMVKSGEIAAAKSAEELRAALQSLRDAARNSLHVVFPVSLVLLATSQWLVEGLLGKPFAGVHVIFDISLLLVIPRLVYPQAVVKAHLKGWVLTGVSLAELMLNVVLSLILMQYWGTAGIAVATVIAYSAEKLFLAIYARAKLGIAFTSYTPILLWLPYSASLLALAGAKYLMLS